MGLLLFSLYTKPLLTGKHKGRKFHFIPLNSCLDDVKEWMSTNKLKLNLDNTEFIFFGSKKKKREKLKAWFPIDIM